MTTSTSKHVKRVTDDAYASRILGSKARRIVVKIAGEYLMFRQLGTRTWERVLIIDEIERARSQRVLSGKNIHTKRRHK